MLQDKFFVRISAYLLDEIPITFIPNTIYEMPNLTVYKWLYYTSYKHFIHCFKFDYKCIYF